MVKTSFQIALLLLGVSLMGCQKSSNPSDPAVKAFINEYFNSWSRVDFETYRSCFHRNAQICMIRDDGTVIAYNTQDFLRTQQEIQERNRLHEYPTKIQIETISETKVVAIVDWVLERKTGRENGVDIFTLSRSDGKARWKIAQLSFWFQPENQASIEFLTEGKNLLASKSY